MPRGWRAGAPPAPGSRCGRILSTAASSRGHSRTEESARSPSPLPGGIFSPKQEWRRAVHARRQVGRKLGRTDAARCGGCYLLSSVKSGPDGAAGAGTVAVGAGSTFFTAGPMSGVGCGVGAFASTAAGAGAAGETTGGASGAGVVAGSPGGAFASVAAAGAAGSGAAVGAGAVTFSASDGAFGGTGVGAAFACVWAAVCFGFGATLGLASGCGGSRPACAPPISGPFPARAPGPENGPGEFGVRAAWASGGGGSPLPIKPGGRGGPATRLRRTSPS